MREITNCPECGAKPGETHQDGCDVERCRMCGHQSISCKCIYEVNGIDVLTMEQVHPDIYTNGATEEMWTKFDAVLKVLGGRCSWEGQWPGASECQELGFWCVEGTIENPGWKSVPAGTPGAREDLTRLSHGGETRWDQKQGRWVLS
jgi:hypothetical protein